MLKIIPNPEFKAPVKVVLPVDGGQREAGFTAKFRALTRSEQAAYDIGTPEGTDDFLASVVTGWEGLADEDGEPFEFSALNLRQLLDLGYVRVGLTKAYFEATSGIRAAKRGN